MFQISVTTIKLGQVEFIQQSEGLKSAIKAHISNIALEECPTIPWDEFQVIHFNFFRLIHSLISFL